jgi:hypothetical protein
MVVGAGNCLDYLFGSFCLFNLFLTRFRRSVGLEAGTFVKLGFLSVRGVELGSVSIRLFCSYFLLELLRSILHYFLYEL